MTRPGVVFLRRKPVDTADLLAVARRRALLPVLVTALLGAPYAVVSALEPPPAPEMLVQGTVLVQTDPWPARLVALGVSMWAGLCSADVFRLVRERERRLMRLDEDEVECWPDGARRHVAMQDLVGARLDQPLGGRGVPVGGPCGGVVLYVRVPGAEELEVLRLDAAARAPMDRGIPDGNVWLVSTLRELFARRRQLGRPVAACPHRPIHATTDRAVSVAGDERGVVVSTGPQHANVRAGTVRALRLVTPARERDEPPPLRRLVVELEPGCDSAELLLDLDDSPADDEILEYFLLAAARFDARA